MTLTHKKLGITKEIMATKVLPFLFAICIDNNLSLQQVSACVDMFYNNDLPSTQINFDVIVLFSYLHADTNYNFCALSTAAIIEFKIMLCPNSL